jgi:hypothetical protein
MWPRSARAAHQARRPNEPRTIVDKVETYNRDIAPVVADKDVPPYGPELLAAVKGLVPEHESDLNFKAHVVEPRRRLGVAPPKRSRGKRC